MLTIVLATPIFAECGREAGTLARALAELLLSLGHRVEIVCSHAESPRPGYEDHGRMRIQRLQIKRQNLDASFAAAAAHRIAELARSGRCDRIVAIDSPTLGIMLALSGAVDTHAIPVRSFDLSTLAPDAPMPLFDGLWSPPVLDRPTVLGLETNEVQRERLIDAFRASNAMRKGWALALLDADGTWKTIEPGHAEGPSDDALLVRMEPKASIIAQLALAYGIVSTPCPSSPHDSETLKHAINEAVARPAEERRAHALEQWASSQSTEQAQRARNDWRRMLIETPGEHQLDAWRSYEHHGPASLHTGGAV